MCQGVDDGVELPGHAREMGALGESIKRRVWKGAAAIGEAVAGATDGACVPERDPDILAGRLSGPFLGNGRKLGG